ncbi:ComGF family competence protein [Nicoliella spurrieriana]|uniref:ComGF family competence protein n=1 Tax=Nicoliella spurrieriana TaxID=2925830 RepID=A0A976RS37_9LACO|nr:ComGF family competence protein [Nicoliella spurrieriana]UQS86769.1 ComGF family competence protein [Nicoliella spurrieriana]
MKKAFLKSVRNRNGFTIVESIISLMVVAMVILLCGILFSYVVTRRQHDNHLTAFHLYLRMIESKEYRFKYVEHRSDRLVLKTADKQYIISLANDSIRMTTTHGGYVPLIDGVDYVEWHYHRDVLMTRVIMQNGDVFKAKSLLKTG